MKIMLLRTCTSEQCFFQSSWVVTEYAKALHNLGDAALKVKWEFDIAYLIAKHSLAFTKMGPLCELEERHGVDLGQGYKDDHAPLGDEVFIGFLGCEEYPVCICTAFIFTCQIVRAWLVLVRLIDVLTLRQSNFQDVIGSTAELAQCACLRLAPTMLKHLPIVPQLWGCVYTMAIAFISPILV